jgi:DNA-binding GntR family transcriptional regulator
LLNNTAIPEFTAVVYGGRVSTDALDSALRRIPMAPLHRPSAAQQVGTVLREQIVDGHLRSGTRLVEESISAALGFSRNTIREAFALLAAERLVVREAHRGVFVATPTRQDVQDLYAARRLLEPSALERGPGVDEAAVTELRAVVTEGLAAAESGEVAAVAQANQRFHRRVAALGGSRRVTDLMEGMLAEMRLVFHVMATEPAFHADFMARNARVVELLEAGDRVAAGAEMRDYLAAAEARLLEAPVWDERR